MTQFPVFNLKRRGRVLVLFVFCGILISIYFSIPECPGKTNILHAGMHPERKILFIVGQGRVGSTLLGELFNQHESFIYFFEPLFSVRYGFKQTVLNEVLQSHQQVYRTEVTELLKDMMTCNYRQRNDEYLAQFNMNGFRHRSKKLTSSLFCEGKKCLKVNSTLMNELCANKSLNIVMKILSYRLPDGLHFLENLSKYGQISIINLVRDPRAYLSSMKNVGFFRKNEEKMFNNSCANVRKNIQFGLERVNVPLSIAYTVLRYEDINLSSTMKLGLGLSRVLGLNIVDHTVKYFNDKIGHTANITAHTKKEALLLLFNDHSRNITTMINKWRNDEKFIFVHRVQSGCEEIMKLLGYEMVTDEEMMKNESKSLIKPFPLEQVHLFKYAVKLTHQD